MNQTLNRIVVLTVMAVGAIYAYIQHSAGKLSLIPGRVSVAALEKQVQGPQVSIVKFGASWCGPCRMLDKELDKVKSNVNVIKIEVARSPELSRKFGVSSIPHTVLFKNGKQVAKFIGYRNSAAITELARQYGAGVSVTATSTSNAAGNRSPVNSNGINTNPFYQPQQASQN